MSNKKDQLISQLQSRYETKFGSSDTVRQFITSELSKISRKNKISFEDLSELESKISTVSHTTSPLATPLSLSIHKSPSSPHRVNKVKSNEFNQAIMKIHASPLERKQNVSISNNNKSQSPYLKSIMDESISNSNTNTLPPISPTYLNPIELKVLKSHDNLSKSRMLLADTSFEEKNEMSFKSSDSPQLSPIRVNHASYRLPPGMKKQEREKAISQNIWKKIDELNLKKAEDEENKKVEKKKHRKEEWLTNLEKQISEKIDKKELAKQKDLLWSQKSVEIDLQLKIDQEEIEKAHRRNIRSLERENYIQVIQEKAEENKKKEAQKEREAHQVNRDIEEYSKKKKLVDESTIKKKAYLKEDRINELNSRALEIKTKLNQSKEEDIRSNENTIEKIMQEEAKSADFLNWLKNKAKNMPDAQPASQKGYDNLRAYGEIGVNESSEQGLMKFLYAERHSEQVRTHKKMVHQKILQKSYEQQRNAHIERKQEYKNYIDEQNSLWKQEEDNMNAREELTAKVIKLKKQMTKEDLDAQREIDSPLKSQVVAPHELWVNKGTLKELQAISEKQSHRLPQLRGY